MHILSGNGNLPVSNYLVFDCQNNSNFCQIILNNGLRLNMKGHYYEIFSEQFSSDFELKCSAISSKRFLRKHKHAFITLILRVEQ